MTDDPTTAATTTDEDGPVCDLCGRTDCPDADLPGFSEPVRCTYTRIYDNLRYDRCDYGCGRDLTKATIRRDIVPVVEAVVAAGREAATLVVRSLLASEEDRLTTAETPEPRKVPMLGNYLGGISAAADHLAARPGGPR